VRKTFSFETRQHPKKAGRINDTISQIVTINPQKEGQEGGYGTGTRPNWQGLKEGGQALQKTETNKTAVGERGEGSRGGKGRDRTQQQKLME